ncbi:hypothetical protein BB559_000618, partial [Furculomyces boomerangus]
MTEISNEQVSRYDRQIRLWGFDGQQRMLKSKILVIGVNPLTMEMSKNLVLGGIGQLSIMDDGIVNSSDTHNLYILGEEHVGEKKSKCIVSELKGFNPTVNIISVPQESEYTAQFFSDYDLVVASNSGMSEQVKINNVCREANIKFISANIFGLYGYIFCDLLDHDYKV